MKKKGKEVLEIEDNIVFRSTHELHFYWYLKELQENGFVKLFYTEENVKPYDLSEKTDISFINNYNKNNKKDSFNLIRAAIYTPDFFVMWTPKALSVFIKIHFDPKFNNEKLHTVSLINLPFTCIIGEDKEVFSIIDVKNPYNKQGSRTKFTLLMKWVWDKYRIYVQEIHVEKLFAQTFVPKRYNYTDNSLTRKRTINIVNRNLNDYIKIRKK